MKRFLTWMAVAMRFAETWLSLPEYLCSAQGGWGGYFLPKPADPSLSDAVRMRRQIFCSHFEEMGTDNTGSNQLEETTTMNV